MDINEFNESLEGLIKQAESLNAGETSIAWDYNNEWRVKIVVKRKRKRQTRSKNHSFLPIALDYRAISVAISLEYPR